MINHTSKSILFSLWISVFDPKIASFRSLAVAHYAALILRTSACSIAICVRIIRNQRIHSPVQSAQNVFHHSQNYNVMRSFIYLTNWNWSIRANFVTNVLANWSMFRLIFERFTRAIGRSFAKNAAKVSWQKERWKNIKLHTVKSIHSSVSIVRRNSKIWPDYGRTKTFTNTPPTFVRTAVFS